MSTMINDGIALVTGANRGIGRSITEALLGAGVAKVYLAVRNIDSTAELEAQYGDRVQTVYADLSKKDSIGALAKKTDDVNIVVNNAGILEIADPMSSNFEAAFEKELSVNVYGLVWMAQAFAPALERNQGSFVQLNSIASIKNFVGCTSYSASKAAAYSITQGIRETFLPKGIHVVSVHPGPIDTDMAADAGLMDIADDVTTVSQGILSAIESKTFHLFPDNLAKEFGEAYRNYAEAIVEPIQNEA